MKLMHSIRTTLALLLGVLAAPALLHAQTPVGTAFTYQGQLKEDGSPANGIYDFQFALYDGPDFFDSLIAGPISLDDEQVNNGLFTVQLDFGDVFDGTALWLWVLVRSGDSAGEYTDLWPRQPLTAAPYALYALDTAGGAGGNTLDEAYDQNGPGQGRTITADAGPVTITGDGLTVDGAVSGTGFSGWDTNASDDLMTSTFFSGDVTGPFDATVVGNDSHNHSDSTVSDDISINNGRLYAPSGAGNVGIGMPTPGAQLHVGGTPGVDGIMFPDGTLQTTAATAGGNTLDEAYDEGGAGAGRTINADAGDVEILGPYGLAVATTIQSGSSITIDGAANTISSDADLELHVSSGRALRIEPDATSPNFIGGHSGNSVTAGVKGATIGGGGNADYPNRVTDHYGTIAGGHNNQAGDDDGTLTDAEYATIGGGQTNTASADWATVGGGRGNTASDPFATVAGGQGNTADGGCAAIGGGQSNSADGDFAVVPGGTENHAGGDHSFAAGRSAKAEHRGAFVWADAWGTDFASTAIDQFSVRAGGGTRIFSDSAATVGVQLAPGGNSWSAISDRALKENFTHVDTCEILHKLSLIPITFWNLKSQDPSIQHIGPMAQDIHAAFGLGESERYISSSDADGIALAAIQGLYEIVQEKDAEIAAQQEQITELTARLDCLEALLAQSLDTPKGGAR
jgi:hypothetical protein